MSLMRRLTKSVRLRFVLLFLTVLSGGSLRVQGQSENSPPAARPQAIEPPSARNEVRVHANEVVAQVMVIDNKGQPILDLSQNDFHVFDNGIEQRIDHW